MPLETHALNYQAVVEAIEKSLYLSHRRTDILPLLPNPVVTTSTDQRLEAYASRISDGPNV